MARVRFDVGADADILSPAESRHQLDQAFARQEQVALAGIKHMYLPMLQGAAVGGSLLLGQAAPVCTPRAGYSWSVMALAVAGLTSGGSPDVVNFYIDNPTGNPWWQLNGNQWAETFGKLQRVIKGGSSLLVASSGMFAATGTITVTGEVIEVPTEMLGKLALWRRSRTRTRLAG